MRGYSKEEAYALFEEAVHNLINANYIMTAKPISELLKFVVYNELVQGFVRECNRSVNYDNLLKAAISKAEGKWVFALPQNNRAIITLVINLLYDFEKGNQSLDSFIANCYPATDLKASYNMFADEVLVPFRDAFRSAFLLQEDLSETHDPENDKLYSKVNPAVIEQAAAAISVLRTDFLADNKLKAEERKDYTHLVDGLYEALEKGEARLASVIWTGISYILGTEKRYYKQYKDLENTLRTYAIIK